MKRKGCALLFLLSFFLSACGSTGYQDVVENSPAIISNSPAPASNSPSISNSSGFRSWTQPIYSPLIYNPPAYNPSQYHGW